MTFDQLADLMIAQLYHVSTTQPGGYGGYYSLLEIASTRLGESDVGKVIQIGKHLETQGLLKLIIDSGPNVDGQLEPRGIQYVESGGKTGLIPRYLNAIKESTTDRFMEELGTGKLQTQIVGLENPMKQDKLTSSRVFLSHKGADKPQVRLFFQLLNTLGFHPWLDEDAMPAGTELERGLLQGFKDSCAAIFFITPSFHDEGYLRTEINYAMAEKRIKGDRFAIVTIVFTENGRKGVVPELLKQFVWKEPPSDLIAAIEILRALPIEVGEPRWRR